MNRQNKNAHELSNEEMKNINGGSGIFDGLPVLGDLLGGGLLGGDSNNGNNGDYNGGEDGHGRQSSQSSNGGLLGGIL